MSNQHQDSYCILVDQPYPPVQANTRRKDYARAMLSNVGSGNSEMSAVSLYFYNSVILTPEQEQIARCFHQIGVVEMHHLKIFATLAFQMGEDPRLWSFQNRSRPTYWSPACNRYPRCVRQVIENAIRGEEAAIQKYTYQLETIRDTNLVDNLTRIILDEKRHIEVFQSMLSSL